jgi:radical SAM superfamily enzyme YgiQ (UPF0313 family)
MSFRVLEKNQERVIGEKNLVERHMHAPLKIALCFPNIYRLGMANLGFQRVYQLFNRIEGVFCDRAFFPDPEDLGYHQRSRVPVYGIESGRPISEFDAVAFSFPFELDYLNALRMLAISGVPLRAKDRLRQSGKKHRYPLVIAGGMAASANPEPMSDFFDFIALGDAEPLVERIVELVRDHGADVAGQGIYDPTGGKPVARAVAEEKQLPAFQQIFSSGMEFAELGLIELMRGCKRGCRFCLEGYFCRPVREAGLAALIAGIEAMAVCRKKLGLIAPVVPDYSKFSKLLDYLERERRPFSVSSLRIEAIDERLVALLKASGNQTITLAPESGCEPVRGFINKKISGQKILSGMKIVGKHAFERVKLYYQVGYPCPECDEVEGIVESVGKIAGALAEGSGRGRYPGALEVGVSVFVPKPWTALQWCAMQGKNELDRKMKRLRQNLGATGGIELKLDSVREAILQGMIARGDRGLAPVLEQLALGRKNINEIIKDQDLLAKYLGPRSKDENFPWEIVAPGVTRDYLRSEFEAGLAGKSSPGCRKGCVDCGAC